MPLREVLNAGRLAGIGRDTLRLWRQTSAFLATTWRTGRENGAPPDPQQSPHLLLLARYLPPAVKPGVYRPAEVMRVAAVRGWRVTAVSSPAPETPTAAGQELAQSIPPSVRLVPYEPPPESDASYHLSPRLSGGFDTIEPIVEAARMECQHSPPSLVMASGPPFAEFVAALVLSSAWRVPLVLDYRDEWTECPFPFSGVGNVDRFWETRCLKRASLVFFTTESQRTHQVQRFGVLDAGRTVVAPNGWNQEPENAATVSGLPPAPPAISFVGLLGEHCDLEEFLATLGRTVALDPAVTQRIRFAFVGTKTPADRKQLAAFAPAEILLNIGQVPLSQAQAIMRGSAALLLFNGPRFARYIPGKAYDYMASRRRILLYGEGGELDRLLQDYPLALRVSRGDAAGLLAAVERITGEPSPDERTVADELVARFSRVRSAENQVVALERLLRVSSHAVA